MASIHPDRTRWIQEGEEKDSSPPEREPCSNCGKSHPGICAAVSCELCNRTHLPNLKWCDNCQDCRRHPAYACTKRPPVSQSYGNISQADLNNELIAWINAVNFAAMTAQFRRNPQPRMTQTASRGEISKMPRKPKRKNSLQAMNTCVGDGDVVMKDKDEGGKEDDYGADQGVDIE